jgi:uncharacterized protein (TIGR00251 family)
MDSCFRIDGGKILLDLKAVPGASITEFTGINDGRLRIRLAAAPEDGKANAELIGFLSNALGCAQRDLQLISGEKSRLKVVALPGECLARVEVLGALHT